MRSQKVIFWARVVGTVCHSVLENIETNNDYLLRRFDNSLLYIRRLKDSKFSAYMRILCCSFFEQFRHVILFRNDNHKITGLHSYKRKLQFAV